MCIQTGNKQLYSKCLWLWSQTVVCVHKYKYYGGCTQVLWCMYTSRVNRRQTKLDYAFICLQRSFTNYLILGISLESPTELWYRSNYCLIEQQSVVVKLGSFARLWIAQWANDDHRTRTQCLNSNANSKMPCSCYAHGTPKLGITDISHELLYYHTLVLAHWDIITSF